MDKSFLLGSLFLRLSSIYSDMLHGDTASHKKNRRKSHDDYEDLLEKAPWKVDLLAKDSEETTYRKVA